MQLSREVLLGLCQDVITVLHVVQKRHGRLPWLTFFIYPGHHSPWSSLTARNSKLRVLCSLVKSSCSCSSSTDVKDRDGVAGGATARTPVMPPVADHPLRGSNGLQVPLASSCVRHPDRPSLGIAGSVSETSRKACTDSRPCQEGDLWKHKHPHIQSPSIGADAGCQKPLSCELTGQVVA